MIFLSLTKYLIHVAASESGEFSSHAARIPKSNLGKELFLFYSVCLTLLQCMSSQFL